MRVSVFVDGANFFYMQKSLGWDINPKRLIEFVKNTTSGEVVDAFYYIGEDAPPEVLQERHLKALCYM